MSKIKTEGGYATEETQQDILAAIGPGPAAEPVKFRRDGAIQEVTEDTGTPANNRALPVKVSNLAGDINIQANDLKVALDSANDSVECIQDTHDDLNLNANMQIGDNDVDAANPVPITLPGDKADLDSGAGTDNHEIIAIGLPGAGGHVVGGTATNPLAVTATDLDIRDLSHTTDSVELGDGTNTVAVAGASSDSLKVITNSTDSSMTVTASDLDVRDLSHTTDSVELGDGTNTVAVAGASTDSLKVITNSTDSSMTVTASDLDVRDLSHTTDSVELGDGTNTVAVAGASTDSLKVITNSTDSSMTVTASALDIRDLSHTTDSVELGDGTNTVAVAGASTDSLKVITNSTDSSMTVTASDLDIRDLSHTTDSVELGDGTNTVAVAGASTDSLKVITNSTDSSMTVTASDLDIRDLSHTTDSVELGDGTNTVAVAGTSSDSLKVITSAADSSVDANIQVGNTDVDDANPVPIKIGTGESIPVTSGKMDVLDFIDNTQGPVLDASTTNIPSLAAGNAQIVVAALAANVKAVYVADTTGQFIGVYNKLTPASVDDGLEFIINPGMDRLIEVDLSGSAGTGIYLRNMVTGVINSGQLMMQFLG